MPAIFNGSFISQADISFGSNMPCTQDNHQNTFRNQGMVLLELRHASRLGFRYSLE